MDRDEWFNTMFKACYHEQIISEACDGDYKMNHFRENMTLDRCEREYAESVRLRESAPLLMKVM